MYYLDYLNLIFFLKKEANLKHRTSEENDAVREDPAKEISL